MNPDDLMARLNSTATGEHLLLGSTVLTFAIDEADPTSQTNVEDGKTLLWVDGVTLKLSTFSRTLGGWKTVSFS